VGEGPVVLVTGGSSGIGRACVENLARTGYRVFSGSRSTPMGLLDGQDGVRGLPMDVHEAESVDRAVAELLAEAGRLDAVVNCAGFGIGGAIEDTSIEEAKRQFETNLFGTMRVCQATLPVLRKQRSGRVVNVSSIAGRIAVPFQGLYTAAKFAIEGLTEALRMEVRPFGIHVSLIEPGDFNTGFTEARERVADRTDGAYADRTVRAMEAAESDERNGHHPERVARLLLRILSCRRPRLRYTVGPMSQRLAAMGKPFLPPGLTEREVMKHYNVQ